jgi:hypothetical protein
VRIFPATSIPRASGFIKQLSVQLLFFLLLLFRKSENFLIDIKL